MIWQIEVTCIIQRVPWRQRSTPSQSKPTTSWFSGEGSKNSTGSWPGWVTICTGTEGKRVSSSWTSPPRRKIKLMYLKFTFHFKYHPSFLFPLLTKLLPRLSDKKSIADFPIRTSVSVPQNTNSRQEITHTTSLQSNYLKIRLHDWCS